MALEERKKNVLEMVYHACTYLSMHVRTCVQALSVSHISRLLFFDCLFFGSDKYLTVFLSNQPKKKKKKNLHFTFTRNVQKKNDRGAILQK